MTFKPLTISYVFAFIAMPSVILGVEEDERPSFRIKEITFIVVPAGECLVGALADDKEAAKDEYPQHRCVVANEFALTETEITVSEFQRFVSDTGFVTEDERRRRSITWRSDFLIQNLGTPVRQVAWGDCIEFCSWLSADSGHEIRLPTEHEWEYACRARSETVYHFGSSADELFRRDFICPKINKSWIPCPVKSYPPNGFGLYGMLGNVSEYCSDDYGRYSDEVSDAHQSIRRGNGLLKVVRGGSFYKDMKTARCSARR